MSKTSTTFKHPSVGDPVLMTTLDVDDAGAGDRRIGVAVNILPPDVRVTVKVNGQQVQYESDDITALSLDIPAQRVDELLLVLRSMVVTLEKRFARVNDRDRLRRLMAQLVGSDVSVLATGARFTRHMRDRMSSPVDLNVLLDVLREFDDHLNTYVPEEVIMSMSTASVPVAKETPPEVKPAVHVDSEVIDADVVVD